MSNSSNFKKIASDEAEIFNSYKYIDELYIEGRPAKNSIKMIYVFIKKLKI